MTDRGGRGMTLIEALVVVATVGTLAAMAGPAVVEGRQEARRQGSANNLKQMGLATHNYFAAYGCFPMSVVEGKGHGRGHSCFTAILPFLEQGLVYNNYNFDREPYDRSNATAVTVKLATFQQPGAPESLRPAVEVETLGGAKLPAGVSFAPSHYGANWGGGRAGKPWGKHFLETVGSYKGVILPVRPEGVDAELAHNVKIQEITDGTSYTVAMAEKRDSWGWAVGGWGGSEFDAAPSTVYEGGDPVAGRVYPGSHTVAGGVLVAMCDGSVHTLPAGQKQATWYALLTRAGSEVIPPAEFPVP